MPLQTLQHKQCVLEHTERNGLRCYFQGKFRPCSTVFQKIVKIFSKFFFIHILTKKYKILSFGRYQKSLTIFLIFSRFGRRSNKMAGYACDFTTMNCKFCSTLWVTLRNLPCLVQFLHEVVLFKKVINYRKGKGNLNSQTMY